MRLICGVLRLDGAPASEDLLRRMVGQMEIARLRPALAIRMDGPAGLAVLDFSMEGPLSLPERAGAVMAGDVRLDEPEALASIVGGQPSAADDALLHAAIEAFGPGGLDRVLGDFAFARWDAAQGVLTCGRDVFGIRPFAYVWRPGAFFAFASFPAMLLEAGIVPKTHDEIALARWLTRSQRADDSLIAGVGHLPPAHYLQVSASGLSTHRYFQFDRAAIGTRICSPDQAAAELRRLVEQAVACRLPKDGEAGAYLSGGLDSSAVAVLAARRLREEGRRLHAFSVLDRQRNDITLEDETESVRLVLDQEKDIDWCPVRPPSVAATMSDPFESDRVTRMSADAPNVVIAAHAETKGISIVLSGWGGDEAASYGGAGALFDLFRRGRWRRLARELKALERERGWPRWRTLRGQVLWPLVPSRLKRLAERLLGHERPHGERLSAMLSLAVRARADKTSEPENWSRIGERRYDMVSSPHLAKVAEELAFTGAKHGVGFAFPLLDRRVIDFALSLPHDLFLRDGVGRRVFRDAMQGVLPDGVRMRQRKLVSVPSRHIEYAECKDEFLKKLDAIAGCESVRRVIDVDHLRREIEQFPSVEKCKEQMSGNDLPAEASNMAAAVSALATAEYIAQLEKSDTK